METIISSYAVNQAHTSLYLLNTLRRSRPPSNLLFRPIHILPHLHPLHPLLSPLPQTLRPLFLDLLPSALQLPFRLIASQSKLPSHTPDRDESIVSQSRKRQDEVKHDPGLWCADGLVGKYEKQEVSGI